MYINYRIIFFSDLLQRVHALHVGENRRETKDITRFRQKAYHGPSILQTVF